MLLSLSLLVWSCWFFFLLYFFALEAVPAKMNHQVGRIDSDEEPAAAVVNTTCARRDLPMAPTALALGLVAGVGGTETQALDALCGKLKARYAAMTSLPPCVPAVVTFCVGGRTFAVSRTVIEKDPESLLFLLTLKHFTPTAFPLSSHLSSPDTLAERSCSEEVSTKRSFGMPPSPRAITLPDNSPELFAMLLNMLRGYRNAIPGEWMECCRDEATYYGLESSWNARFHVLPEPYYFRNPLHNSKILSDSVLGVASDFLTAGEHHIDFSVVQCDRVGVGVISTASGSLEELGPQAQDGTSGAFYWNDGKLSFYVGEPRMLETGFPFPAGALIRVIFDADERITRWIVNGEYCVAMERLPAGRHYAFASIASRTSQVTIVPL